VEVVSSSLLKSGGPALFQRSHRIEKSGRGIKMILEREHFALKFFPEAVLETRSHVKKGTAAGAVIGYGGMVSSKWTVEISGAAY
jgi:hypothetical protein